MSDHCLYNGRHRRRRRADLTTSLPAILERARSKSDAFLVDVWDLFIDMPGQEHWWCPCGNRPRAVVHELMDKHVTAMRDIGRLLILLLDGERER